MGTVKKVILTAFMVLFIICTIAQAQVNNSPLEQRVEDVMSLFRNNPGNYEQYFSGNFLSQVPADKLTNIFNYYFLNYGKCIKREPTELVNPYSGKFNFIFEKKVSVPVNITVDASRPNLIIALWLGNAVSQSASFEEVIKEFKNLPGRSAIKVVKIVGDKPEPLAAYNSELELAIGSSFKLYILSELLRSINNGSRSWTDVVKLQPEAISIPTGFLQNWPVGAPLTLYTLAALMISQSDNTAADQLLNFLGRKNIEKMLSITGHSNPGLDIPFISTSELFKLKELPGLQEAHEYLSKTAEERRNFLSDFVPHISLDSLTFTGQPVYIDSLEWFASSNDLCSLMNWIRIKSLSIPGAEVRKILSINPGLAISKKLWKYIGYKGGSEPGVINMTFLLQSATGDWFILSASWNNINAPLDESKFFGLVGRTIELIK